MQEVERVDGQIDVKPDADTPFRDGISALRVTEAEARGIRAFIRELRPGLYIKCPRCKKLKYGVQQITMNYDDGVICEGCSNA